MSDFNCLEYLIGSGRSHWGSAKGSRGAGCGGRGGHRVRRLPVKGTEVGAVGAARSLSSARWLAVVGGTGRRWRGVLIHAASATALRTGVCPFGRAQPSVLYLIKYFTDCITIQFADTDPG